MTGWAGTHLAGQDTGRAACTLPPYGEYASEPCMRGDIHVLGNDTVLHPCTMVEDGKWVHAPCRRFGGHGFEDSIYRPGRDTQQVRLATLTVLNCSVEA